jgi:hypothetical protein
MTSTVNSTAQSPATKAKVTTTIFSLPTKYEPNPPMQPVIIIIMAKYGVNQAVQKSDFCADEFAPTS